MSSSLSAVPAAAATTTTASSLLGASGQRNAPATATAAASATMTAATAQFREIHKNTWLKRLSADGKKFTVGPKKSECSWVVFCVHDDTEALLEGYAEPRQAPAHMPEWIVSLRDTLHISHALIPNSHEFEFVVTLSNEVLRFHAVSWDIMQEWVETLRSKLREMKILSPRENLYTKLPEVRAPLLPTRDPTSPLPAPPPVPAAIVPGVERVMVTTQQQHSAAAPTAGTTNTTTTAAESGAVNTITTVPTPTPPPPPTAMSNTLTQNLLNMLTDPISTYSEQINETTSPDEIDEQQQQITVTEHSNNDSDSNLPEYIHMLTNITDEIVNFEQFCDRLIPRPQTSRSLSVGAADREKKLSEATASGSLQSTIATAAVNTEVTQPQDNITIIQVSNISVEQPPKLPPKSNITADIFRFPEVNGKCKTKQQPAQQEYKSNVQIIPSNSNTIQVLGQSSINSASSNAYTMPVRTHAATVAPGNSSSTNTTLVHVPCDEQQATLSTTTSSATTVAVYGTCYPTPAAPPAPKPQTPNLSKKIILNANTSGVTNISVNNEHTADAVIHYEKVFLSSNIAISNSSTTSTQPESPRRQLQTSGSPALPRRRLASPPPSVTNSSSCSNSRLIPQLTRGLTELVISTRPSRRDFHYLKLLNTPLKAAKSTSNKTAATNNNIESASNSTANAIAIATASTPTHRGTETDTDSMEQRRRSSSTSDAPAPLQRAAATNSNNSSSQRGTNNNEFVSGRSSHFRMQQPPQLTNSGTSAMIHVSPNKRLTLREQQVMQLRREIMHPGGVRLNLRRKDCVGSIAWVDAFGSVWIAGWKQKEHPVLYNALHIGDQLLSIAGVSISNAAEANKIIRNTNTLFVEVLLRRMPFGRAYAIRRDRDGQCLGLIRDGNTSTIVDIVPNSLAARHGLPPKAQSCDGAALTFWILTEINGRPLNLFFKDLEIRDRLNSMGRDISILVQPADLISKLKKQLKSLRGYKDYLVQ